MRTKGLEPIKTREYIDLLKEWGFTSIDHGGRHPMMLTPDGLTRFPLSTPGKVTSVEVRRAARLVGVSRRDFLNGPPKKRTMRAARVGWQGVMDAAKEAGVAAVASKTVAEQQLASAEEIVAQLRELEKMEGTAALRAKENKVAKVITSKRAYTKGTSEKVQQFVLANQGRDLRTSEIERGSGAPRTGATHAALTRMAETDPNLVKVERGVWRYGPEIPAPIESSQSNGHKDANVRNKVLAFMEEHADRPVTIDMVVNSLGTIRSSTTAALLALYRLGCIDQVSRGIYQFNTPTSPDPSPGFVSDETTDGFGDRDNEPIDLVPTPTPTGATMWEQIKTLANGRILLQDEDGGLWVASMTRLEV